MKAVHVTYIVIGLIALAGGVYLLLVPALLSNIEPTYRIFFAVIAILYGVYRTVTGVIGIRKAGIVLDDTRSVHQRHRSLR